MHKRDISVYDEYTIESLHTSKRPTTKRPIHACTKETSVYTMNTQKSPYILQRVLCFGECIVTHKRDYHTLKRGKKLDKGDLNVCNIYTKETVYAQKPIVYRKETCVLLRKTQERSINTQKRPIYTQKRPLKYKRDPKTHKGDLCIHKRVFTKET